MNINDIISAIIKNLEGLDENRHFNERYLHHMFSHMIQEDVPISFDSSYGLHPEWATVIKEVRPGGWYKRIDDDYWPVDYEASAGFIDFAYGNSENPEYAIEFKMDKKLNRKGVTFDYMKLLDSRNHFQKAISLVVYYGHKKHSTNCEAIKLDECLSTAQERLGGNFCNRPHQFHVVEIIDKKIVRHLVSSDNLHFENK